MNLSLFFCHCLAKYELKEFTCSVCNKKSSRYFIKPDFIANCYRIISKYFSSGNTIKVTLYTDGVNTFKKSKYAIWPIFLVLNDLPYNLRYKISNIIICGIWYGDSKPNLQILLKIIFFEHIRSLNSSFNLNGFMFKLLFQYIVADKPARSMILNMQSSNSEFFCPKCLCRTKTQTINNKRHVFVDNAIGNSFEKRTHAGFSAVAYSAETYNKPEYGIKGICFLQNIHSINLVESNIFDYMHSICLGVFKSLFNLLFTVSTKHVTFYTRIKEFDKILDSVQFSSSIIKSPPKISNASLWKAKDYRNFFLFCFPILFCEVNHQIVKAVLSLRKGLLVLFQNITQEDVIVAENCFNQFLRTFSEIYGPHLNNSKFS